MKRFFAILMVLAMLLSLVACGSKNEANAADAPNAQANTAAASETSGREHVTLKFYTRTNEQADQQVVFDKLNEYFEEKFNTTVEWGLLGGTYSDKINVIINSGEAYDACFTSNWQNDYLTNVARGAFVDISGMLADYPELYASMPEAFWKATTVDGGIYAVPNQQIAARTPAVFVVEEYWNAFGKTREDLKKMETVSDFAEYAQFCKENYGAFHKGIEPARIGEICGYELLNGQTCAIAVKVGDPDCTVVNLYETPEFAAFCKEMEAMYSQGLTDPQLMLNDEYFIGETMSGRVCGYMAGSYSPSVEISSSNSYQVDLMCEPYNNPFLTTSGIIATMWGVSATSEHPDRVLEILQCLSTDPYAMQMISYGIEGVHYDIVDGFTQLKENSGYNHGENWAFGNVFLTTPLVGMPANVWEETAKINATADVSALMGFSYSVANVEAEMTNISNTYQTYMAVMTGEMPVDKTLEEFNEKLALAGIDAAIADAQAQIDAFLGK